MTTPAVGPPVVLIVDDDAFMRALLQRIFTDAGLASTSFATADALLAEAELPAPAVLLLDVKMPDMSGLELHAALLERGNVLPVVFLTGDSDIPIAVTAMRRGAFDFIEKPFEREDLVHRVRLALASCTSPTPATQHAGPDHAQRLSTLTVREREVHDLMLLGNSSKAIAASLGGSFRTIEIHRTRVMAKMGARHLADLVRMAFETQGATTLR